MASIELFIPDTLLAEWTVYADAAGLSLESMLQEATTHSVRNDRLGVEQAKLQRLLRETRELELLARQGRAEHTGNGSAAKTTNVPAKNADPKPPKQAKTQSTQAISDEGLENSRVASDFFDETGNMANIDQHVPRDI